MQLLGSYINGNYKVSIFDDGTKIRENKLNFFAPAMPESMDIKITNQCDMNCAYCHEASTPTGQHGCILNIPFLDTLMPYTELAIGGGNPICHPDFEEFLKLLKSKKLIANVTVNQKHFLGNEAMLKSLVNSQLIYGLGVSLTSVTDSLITSLRGFPNAVLHVINGIVKQDDLQKLYDQEFKILVLGYKEFRRGKDFHSDLVEVQKKEMYNNIAEITKHFKVVSFDNLAIKQLDLKRILSEEQWNEFYMGDDGFATMYVDMVNQDFSRSSTSTERYPLKDNIKDMFEVIRKH